MPDSLFEVLFTVIMMGLLIIPAVMFEPAAWVFACWVMVSPVNNAALSIPFILAIEGDGITFLNGRYARGQVNIVGDQHGLATGELKNKLLVT